MLKLEYSLLWISLFCDFAGSSNPFALANLSEDQEEVSQHGVPGEAEQRRWRWGGRAH